ncbi:MAG: hypothetical protein H6667_09730 [Ardenticatenaceae bacterium]|nr:hypothetical protein [Ardenticatenaceae bacterium]
MESPYWLFYPITCTKHEPWENELEGLSQDDPDITVYVPVSWSNDQEWLAIWVVKWEGGWMDLGSTSTTQLLPLSGCASISWSPTGSSFSMAIRYSGYLVCGGDDDGVYTVEIGQNGLEEKRVYHEELRLPLNGFPGASYLSRSPDNMQLLFIQEDDREPEARLMLINSDGTVITQLVELPIGMLYSPIWGDNSEYIYYVEQMQDTGSVYEIDTSTFEKRLIYSLTDVTDSWSWLSLSPDGNWLALTNHPLYDDVVVNSLILISIHDNTVIEIATNTVGGALGWQEINGQ